MKEDSFWIREQVKTHNKWFEESLPLIASENLMSPLAKEMMVSDFHDRYAEGLPGNRFYMGNKYVDEVEIRTLELAKRIFNCSFADVRPISGTVANMAVLFALCEPGDVITSSSLSQGAHISTAKFGAVGQRGVRSVKYAWDRENMNIDVEGTKDVILETEPVIAQFGLSLFLFPPPLEELREIFQEVGCTVWYDGAHVLGLISGGEFQQPFEEGADIMTGSTHKTFPGPNHGILLANDISEEMENKLHKAVFPGVTSSHHLHAMAALGVTLGEQEVYGERYARQVIANAKELGAQLYELGMEVLCPHLDFTESHILAIDVSEHGGGKKVSQALEDANIITNKNMLPDDKSAINPSGIRLGTQELTRVGMGESEMKEVARLVWGVASEEKKPEEVKEEVKELKRGFTTTQYCIGGDKEAYEYHDFL